MKENLADSVENILRSPELNANDETIRSYEEGIKILRELQAKGLVKQSGNRLMDLEQRMRPKNHFNQPGQPSFY